MELSNLGVSATMAIVMFRALHSRFLMLGNDPLIGYCYWAVAGREVMYL